MIGAGVTHNHTNKGETPHIAIEATRSRSIALGPHYETYVKIVGGGGGGKKGKQLKCGGGIVKPYGEKIVHLGVKAPNLEW